MVKRKKSFGKSFKGSKKFAKAISKFKTVKSKAPKRVIDPQWDLDRDGVTYSFLSKFMGCRQRAHIQYVQGWVSKKISLPLEFGNIFHLYKQAQHDSLDIGAMSRIGLRYIESRIREKNMDAKDEEELHRIAAVAHVTFGEYVKYWKKTASIQHGNKWYYDRDFFWIEKEQAFEQPYQMPDGRIVKLRGKQDGKFQISKSISGNWLLENKTKGDIDIDGIKFGLTKDLQTGLYLTTLWLKDGVCPRGFLYNVIRRTRLVPRVSESPKKFAERVREDIVKRPEWYFMRWAVEITPQDIVDFQQRQLNPILFQLVTWWDSIKRNPMNPFFSLGDKGELVPNIHHFERPFGVYDEMAHSVRGTHFEIIMNGNYHLYERKKAAFPELIEDDYTKFIEGDKHEGSEGKRKKIRFR